MIEFSKPQFANVPRRHAISVSCQTRPDLPRSSLGEVWFDSTHGQLRFRPHDTGFGSLAQEAVSAWITQYKADLLERFVSMLDPTMADDRAAIESIEKLQS